MLPCDAVSVPFSPVLYLPLLLLSFLDISVCSIQLLLDLSAATVATVFRLYLEFPL